MSKCSIISFRIESNACSGSGSPAWEENFIMVVREVWLQMIFYNFQTTFLLFLFKPKGSIHKSPHTALLQVSFYMLPTTLHLMP